MTSGFCALVPSDHRDNLENALTRTNITPACLFTTTARARCGQQAFWSSGNNQNELIMQKALLFIHAYII